jgi:hypothetical protein
MKTNYLFTLVRDTRPTSHILAKLQTTYWTCTLGQLLNHSHELGTVTETGISYRVTFRHDTWRGQRVLRATITPHSSGHVYTNLTTQVLFALKPKLVGEDRVDLSLVQEVAS